VLSLALGIGANLAIFSLTTEFLFSRPSVRDPQNLAYVILGGNSNAAPAQYRFLKDAHLFDGLAISSWRTALSRSCMTRVFYVNRSTGMRSGIATMEGAGT
jgi:hypothetical protein